MPSTAAPALLPLAPRQVGGAIDTQHREAALLMACELAARAQGTSVLTEWEALCPQQVSAHAHATPSAHAGPGLLAVEMAGAGLGSTARDARDAAPPVHGPRQWVKVRGASTTKATVPIHERDRQKAARYERNAQHQDWRSQGMARTSPHGARHKKHVERNGADASSVQSDAAGEHTSRDTA